jgi:hypothetical protein
MKRAVQVLCLLIAMCILACGKSQVKQVTVDTFSKTIAVSGKMQWTDTQIDLKSGDRLSVEAEGTVYANATVFCGPDGVPGRPDWKEKYNLLKTANHESLIGKIGESGQIFFVGKSLDMNADTTGRLFLGVNDNDVANNKGEFKVKITITKK